MTLHVVAMVDSKYNKGFDPPVEKRGLTANYAMLIALVVSILCIMAISYQDLRLCALSFSRCCFTIVLAEIIIRLCLLMEEIKHKNSRYGGSWKAVLKTTFRFSGKKMAAIFVIFIFTALTHYVMDFPSSYADLQLIQPFVYNISALPVALYLIGLRKMSPVEISELNERENKNVADGLAWSYYYGYLKFVLPQLEKKVENSDYFRLKIAVKKLFILLPKSCVVPDKITEEDERMKIAGPLPVTKISSGGIYERVYKHTVYHISRANRDCGGVSEYYCIAEYAIPLRTLFDMSNDSNAALTREERDQQCMVFIRKLREILESDDECRGKYELVMTGEELNIGDDKRQAKIADVLVKHLSLQKQFTDN